MRKSHCTDAVVVDEQGSDKIVAKWDALGRCGDVNYELMFLLHRLAVEAFCVEDVGRGP